MLPTSPDTTFTCAQFRTLALVRLHLPLHLEERTCKCGQVLDVHGHHRSACSRVGLLVSRGTPTEVCAARICREGRARVKENHFLRDLNVPVPPSDSRRIEVIANGLPLWGGKQIALDTTVISALTGKGQVRGRTAGTAFDEARKTKEKKYAELVESRCCHLPIMGFEVASRWSNETALFSQCLT